MKPKPLLLGDDPESTDCVAAVRNITASTELPKGQVALLSGAEEKSVTLVVPSRGMCSVGHVIVVRFFDRKAYERVGGAPRSVQEKAQILSVTGKVAKVEAGPADGSVVECVLQQFNEAEWRKFRAAFAPVQGRVGKLAKRIKS